MISFTVPLSGNFFCLDQAYLQDVVFVADDLKEDHFTVEVTCWESYIREEKQFI